MASSLNQAILLGRVGKAPEARTTQSGKTVTSFSLATSEGPRDNERTEWHHIVAWERCGEICAEYVNKGDLLMVQGRIQTRKWTDKNGQDRYSTEIIADRITLMPNQRREAQQHDRSAPEPEVEVPSDNDIPF